MVNNNPTMFAPAERASAKSVMRDAEILQTAVFAEHVVRVLPFSLMILNWERQVVYMNQRLMDLLHASSHEEVLGKRPGELLHCIHAYENNAGCGTTESCRECGAVRAILKSQKDKVQVSEECRVTSTSGDAYDLRAWASPYTFEGRSYTFFSVEDIHQEKRRLALERTFFHDVNNTLSPIVGCADLMGKARDVESAAKCASLVQWAGRMLVDEIESHKRLLQAENKELSVAISTVQPLSILREVIGLFSQNQSGQDRNIVVKENSEEIEIATDKVLLRRVLRNMLKNALEETQGKEEVCLSYAREQSSVVFSVHNPGCIPRSVQLQLFQRSFSTKGEGRGIGTYSMKLFGERYLKGKVWFSTSEEKGTTFFLSIPITYEA
ncbi:Histidine kinase-, DNA gyrase B-, and HSP90-like ATPase [Candidatus Electrothrix aarhusensis]|uniref:Histidine kinase-, DNA gyrase B-, and HSP90-like ATPase n=1 Tax=Candidatus Electrothrix aarhusensis TaxID=1859131 RepID=A0A3S3QPE4_9BACT|nr:Histidine kinase-, DNA gyrase B-, and HSP90-like ATPase [Candidatus Electrothrix aarhusensis]